MFARFYGWRAAWADRSFHDVRGACEVPGPVQGVRPRDEPARADDHEDRCTPDQGGATIGVQGDLRVARHDDGRPAELLHTRVGSGVARRDRGDGPVRQVRGLTGHVHRVARRPPDWRPGRQERTRLSAQLSGTTRSGPPKRNLILATRIRGPEGVGSWISGTNGRGRTLSRRTGPRNSTPRTRPRSTTSARISDRSIR